ncbi:unnamed protein product [Heterobilharzia americana]|nr:unnamed protein product [Heterobilharzia americana]
MNLNKKTLSEFMDNYPVKLTPGIEKLIQQFKENGIHIYLASGGLYPLVNRVAKLLSIPEENIFANKLVFTKEGAYSGFDTRELTSRSDGKALIVAELMDRLHTSVMIIGDGITDANACPPAEVFIGFGVNIIRPEVQSVSTYFCTSMDELLELLRSNKMLK